MLIGEIMDLNPLNIGIGIVNAIENGIKPLIGWDKSEEVVGMGADGTPTKRIDSIAESIGINYIEKNCDAYLISEEIGFKKIGKNPKYVIVLDPIDGTYNALKNIPIYSISVAIGEININNNFNNFNNFNFNENNNKNKNINNYNKNINNIDKIKTTDSNNPVSNLTINDLTVGVVKNISTGDMYYGIKDKGAYYIKNGIKKKITVSNTKNLKDASVGVFAYGLTTNTLNFIKDRTVKRIRILGSTALELCYVSRGALDAFINVNETTRLCDIAGGYVILKESGGLITNKNGLPINMKLDVNEKSSIICSNSELHRKFVGIFGNKWALKPTKFLIVSRIDRIDALKVAIDIIKYIHNKNVDFVIDESLYKKLLELKESGWDISEEIIKNRVFNNLEDVSHAISIGGDGTVLRTVRLIDGEEIPIISINKGTVGFLTEFDLKNMFSAIDSIIYGTYEIERRTKLRGMMQFNNGDRRYIGDALNEFVVITKKPAKMMHFEIYINGNLVEEVKSDGIIVSTPTGSTAYSLSAGGPILEPVVDAFIIVPICPFKSFSRPIVVDGNSEIRIKILKKDTLIVVDGNVEMEGTKNDNIILRKSPSYAYFVKGGIFYNKLKKLV